jgi:hypothetical protein
MKRLAAGILIAGSLTLLGWSQAAPQAGPTWADPNEAAMGIAADQATNPAQKLDLLKKWEQQYPNSALKNKRTGMMAYALLSIVGAAYGKPAGDPAIAPGQKDAKQLAEHFDEYFDDAVRPAGTTPEQWTAIKKTVGMQVHLVLAWIAQVQKDDAAGEAECRKVLAIDPTQALCSYQIGATILHEMKESNTLTRYPEALYHLARSLWVTGPEALPATIRPTAEKFLKSNYTNYHGSTDGLDDLIAQTSPSPFPGADFQILSVNQLAALRQKDHDVWAQQHPELNFWETIKAALEDKGDTAFAGLQGVLFPPVGSDSYNGPAMFSATVVSTPSTKQLLVNVDNSAGDAVLKFDENIKGDIPAGTAIRFKGVVDSYTKDPAYVLTLIVQDPKTDITGLPDGVTFAPDAKGKTISKTRK